MFVCVAGKNDISVNVLQWLIEHKGSRYELGIVCNQNETGKDSWQRSLRAYARSAGVKEYRLEEVYDIPEQVFLSLEFDQIVKPEKWVDARMYNVHFSLLPKYRGMYTSALPILFGEKESGVTLHKIDRGIDTGAIIAQRVVAIAEEDICRDLYLKYIKSGTEMMLEYIEVLLEGTETAVPQERQEATYFSKDAVNYANLRIDLRKTAEQVRNQIRAFCFPEYQYPRVFGREIAKAIVTDNRSVLPPGHLVVETEKDMLVSTNDYDVRMYYPTVN